MQRFIHAFDTLRHDSGRCIVRLAINAPQSSSIFLLGTVRDGSQLARNEGTLRHILAARIPCVLRMQGIEVPWCIALLLEMLPRSFDWIPATRPHQAPDMRQTTYKLELEYTMSLKPPFKHSSCRWTVASLETLSTQ